MFFSFATKIVHFFITYIAQIENEAICISWLSVPASLDQKNVNIKIAILHQRSTNHIGVVPVISICNDNVLIVSTVVNCSFNGVPRVLK